MLFAPIGSIIGGSKVVGVTQMQVAVSVGLYSQFFALGGAIFHNNLCQVLGQSLSYLQHVYFSCHTYFIISLGRVPSHTAAGRASDHYGFPKVSAGQDNSLSFPLLAHW